MVKSPEVAADPVMVNSELPVWVKTISPEVEALDWVTTVADPDLETTKTPPVTVSKFSKLGATASISLLTPVAPIPEMATISIMAAVKSVVAAESPSVTFPADVISILLPLASILPIAIFSACIRKYNITVSSSTTSSNAIYF